MKIHIVCEAKTSTGISFGDVVNALDKGLIDPSQAYKLIGEPDSGINSQLMVYFLLDCEVIEFGTDWVQLQPRK